MDLFDHSYYKLNKIYMTVIGQWPDQSTLTRRCGRFVLIYFYVTEVTSRVRTIYNNSNVTNMIMEALLPIFFHIFGVLYLITHMVNTRTTSKLLNHIRMDWKVWAREREIDILHDYTKLGKKINILFTVTLYTGDFLVALEPIGEKIIDIMLKNGTEPGKFMFLIDYYHVDEQKYFFYVSCYFNIMCIAITAPELAQVVMIITYTQHGTGILAAISHRLECIGVNDKSEETKKAKNVLDSKDLAQVTWCIDRHNDAIEFVNLMEESYKWNAFMSIGLGIILFNVLGLQILAQPSNLQVTLTCGGCSLAMGMLFLMVCVASQLLIDYSTGIRYHIYNSQWYELSPKAQKLLYIMTMRCNVPCQLTAGNRLILSIRSVWLTLKTALSYFTFVRSTQGL